VEQVETSPALAALQLGELDVAVVFDYGRLEVPAPLEAALVYQEPVSLAVPAGHALAGLPEVDMAAVDVGEVLVAPDASVPLATFAHGRLEYAGDDLSVVLALVAAGHGIALVPRLAATPTPPGVVLCALVGAQPSRRQVWVVWSAATERPAPVEAMCTALRQAGARMTT
jgi:DNA-binding transcriptional LysR family regulator